MYAEQANMRVQQVCLIGDNMADTCAFVLSLDATGGVCLTLTNSFINPIAPPPFHLLLSWLHEIELNCAYLVCMSVAHCGLVWSGYHSIEFRNCLVTIVK